MSVIDFLIIFAYALFVIGQDLSNDYRMFSEYANRTCPSRSVGFQYPSHSVLSCLYLCFLHDDCSAVMFERLNKCCNGLRKGHNVTDCTTENGDAEYYRENRIIYQWVEKVTNFSSEFKRKRHGADQVVGPPDCYPVDNCTSTWMGEHSDKDGFIEVAFSRAVFITRVNVHEQHLDGYITRISAMNGNGGEHVLYETAPLYVSAPDVWATWIFSPEIKVTAFKCSVLRIYVDSLTVFFIDAVQMVGRQ